MRRDVSELRYNQVRQLSSHNSYDDNGPKGNIEAQFSAGVRSFELDLHNSGEPQNWDVYHDLPNGDFINNLKDGLKLFAELHRLHPDHETVTIWLELKNDWQADGHSPTDLDRRIAQDLPGLVWGPGDVAASAPAGLDLRACIARVGWPMLDSLRGKFLFVLMGNDDAGEQYMTGSSSQGLCFAAPEDDLEEKLVAPLGDVWRNAVFFNCHNLDGLVVPQAVHRSGLVSRIWRVDDQGEYDFAMASLAHHIATDHVTQDLFDPLLVDAQGRPFLTCSPKVDPAIM